MQIVDSKKPTVSFEEHSQQVIDEFRSALAVVLTNLDVDMARPQDAARRLGLNKNLTWKLSKVISADDIPTAITHLPGASGLDIFLKSLREAGATESQIAEVQRAASAFDTMVETHVNDRSTLELVLDGLAPDDAGALDISRKLLFRGASGVWGVRAKTRFSSTFLSPSKSHDDRVDAVVVSGLHDFMRLRNDISWPLFRLTGWGAAKDRNLYTTIGEGFRTDDGLRILHDFCSPNLPEILEVGDEDEIEYILSPGPLGNLGAIDITYGEASVDKLPKYAEDDDPYAECGLVISTPCENLLQDVYIHHELDPSHGIEFIVFGRPATNGRSPHDPSPAGAGVPLPMQAEIKKIPGTPPTPDTRLVPHQADLVNYVFDNMGWNASDFTGFRAILKYPPLNSFPMVRFRLPKKP